MLIQTNNRRILAPLRTGDFGGKDGSGTSKPRPAVHDRLANDRLDSWKEIAAYLKKEVRTVQRWEKSLVCPYAAWRMENWAPSSLTSKTWTPGGRKARASLTSKRKLMKPSTPPDRTWRY